MSHFVLNTNDMQDMKWSKDNTYLIVIDSVTNNGLYVYSMTGNLLFLYKPYQDNFGAMSLQVSPCGHFISVGYGDNAVRLFHYITYKKICELRHDINLQIVKDNKVKLFKEEDIVPMVDKIMDYYKANAIKGERISATVERIGFNEFKSAIME